MTLFWSIFYLWLVLTILLITLLYLRYQEGRRTPSDRDDDLLLPPADPVGLAPADQLIEVDELDDVDDVDQVEPVSEPEPGEPSATPASPATVAQPPGILDLLDGIELPHDLTPLTGRIEHGDRHLILVSSGADPAEVGPAFADRLADQGFEIEPDGFDQAVARRSDDVLTMRISPEAGTVNDAGRPRYPGAGDDDVVIELWTGNGAPPPLAD
ncbi:MAG: hypothetical protein AAF547_00775 [Actinomycetota bacterium]